MNSHESVTVWLDQLRGGNEQAAEQLWYRYFDRVAALARARLGATPQKAVDEEDVALSVFDTLCRGVTAGKYPQLADRNGLWPLLAVLTVRKACDYIQHERRKKRGGGRILTERELQSSGDEEFQLDEVLTAGPTPEMLAIMDEECSRLLSLLDDGQRRIAQGKLEGFTNQELATQMNCGLRTIERRLDLIRRIWEQAVAPHV